MSNIHKLGETKQRPNESIAYTVDVSNVGSSPTVDDVTALDLSDGSDVSDTKLSGSASVSGDVITTPLVTALVDGETYHIVVQYSISGETFEDFFVIYCTDSR